LAENGSSPRFVGFLDERQALSAQQIMSYMNYKNYMLYGGHDGAERVVFGAFPDFVEPAGEKFPITAVTASFRSCDNLSHRDFLGALLANGINRETIGDILVDEGICVLYSRSEITNFILSQTTKIGRVGVKLTTGVPQSLPQGGARLQHEDELDMPRGPRARTADVRSPGAEDGEAAIVPVEPQDR